MKTKERFFAQAFEDHPMIEVSYEELADVQSGALERIQFFLGVTPEKLRVLTQKLLSDDLTTIVDNYRELSEFFSGTPYETYFSDEREDVRIGG